LQNVGGQQITVNLKIKRRSGKKEKKKTSKLQSFMVGKKKVKIKKRKRIFKVKRKKKRSWKHICRKEKKRGPKKKRKEA